MNNLKFVPTYNRICRKSVKGLFYKNKEYMINEVKYDTMSTYHIFSNDGSFITNLSKEFNIYFYGLDEIRNIKINKILNDNNRK